MGDVYEEKGVKLVDKQNFKNTQPQIIGSVDTSKVGIYVIKYRAKEVNAPYTPYVARIINVIDGRLRDLDDKEAPSLNINGDSMIYVAENFKRYEEKGAISSDDNDGELEVTISETYYANIREMQRLAYISSDKSGNLTIKFREILSSSYIYIPRYKFGTRDENGNIWKAWFFDGSLVFDWSDKYVNNYLRQEFKIEAQPYPNFSCFTCMSKTIFKKDPTKGFDLTDYSRPAGPESHIQNRHDGQIYQVVIQWDENGYSTLITHGDILDYSTYVEVEDVNENMWIGWSTSFSSISGSIERMWQPYATFSSLNLGGSIGMVLEPRKVYDTEVVNFEEGDWDYDEEGDKEGEDDDDSNEEDPLNEDDDDETGGGEEGLETEEGDGESDEDVVVENPIILGIKVNNTEGAVDVDFVSNNALVEISSDRNVDWVSLKIENQEDSGLYKMFFSDGDACVDGTNTCSKSWSGELSNDDIPLKNGLYKVKIHVKDEFGVEIDEYLSYSINVINQPVL